MTNNSHRPRLGIVGGFTPAASAHFYESVTTEFLTRIEHSYPDIIIHSPPLSASLERALINGNCDADDLLQVHTLIRESCQLLATSGATLLVAPCNTIQPYLQSSAAAAGVDYLDIIESTCTEVALRRYRRATLLATTTTIHWGGYSHHAERLGIELSLPGKSNQRVIDATIAALAAGTITIRSASARLATILDQDTYPREAVVLGCTDLSGLNADALHVPVVDSLSCLASASCDNLLQFSYLPG